MSGIFSKKMGARALVVLLVIFLTLLLLSSAVSATTLGDVNSDGTINILDVILVNNYVLGSSTLTAAQRSLADVNRDGVVDIFDTVLIMQMASGLIYEFPILPAPTLTSPANNALVASTLVTFHWNAVSAATMYELEVMNVNSGFIFKNPVLSGSFTFTTQSGFPDNGTPFRWRIRAGNNDGWGAWSAYRNFVNGSAPAGQTTPPPTAPTVSLPVAPVLTVPAASATIDGSSISFQWNPSSGANKYELLVTKISDGSPFRNQVLGEQTYTNQIGFPNDGSQFRWKVRAGNAAGWGSWSDERTFTNSGTLGVPLLTSPAANANLFGSAVTFRWNAASGATRYNLEVRKVSDNTLFRSQELGNVTSVSVTGFPNDGTEYKWRVLAGNLSFWSDTWSVEQTFSNGQLPAAPVLTSPGSTATNPSLLVAGSSISFRWAAPAGVEIDKYNLEIVRIRDGLVVKNLILGNTAVSLQTGFPDDGTEYKWRVRAGSRDGWGPWPAAYFHFTSGGLNAPVLTYPANNANLASSRITFEWKPVSGATKYRLVIKAGTNIFTDVTLGSVYASIQRDFPNDGTEYTWEVYAGNRDGNWSPAATRTFTNGSSLAVPLQLAPVSNAAVVSPAAANYSADFSWSAVSGAAKYQLEVINVRDGSVFANEVIAIVSPATVPATTHNVTNFADGEQYKWRIRAGEGTTTWGTWSSYRDFLYYHATPALSAPSLLSPASYATAATETVEFEWTAVIGNSGYELEVIKVTGGLPYYHNNAIAGVTESATFPNDSTQFMWRVRANENGAWSLYQYFTNGFWWRW